MGNKQIVCRTGNGVDRISLGKKVLNWNGIIYLLPLSYEWLKEGSIDSVLRRFKASFIRNYTLYRQDLSPRS